MQNNLQSIEKEADEVLFEIKNSVGFITLNRPEALNALSLNMIKLMDEKLAAWGNDPDISAVVVQGAGGRSFCSGGDVKVVALDIKASREGASDGQLYKDFFRAEYILNHRIFNFPKPYISIIDGIVMGGGKGVSAHGSHRVVTENALFAMPETNIGFFPDVGGSYFLPRCPGEMGTYLAMTSKRIKAADTLYIGFGTHFVPHMGIELLLENLVTADWNRSDPMSIANTILANFNSSPEEAGELASKQTDIDRHFGHDRVEDIISSLKQDDSEWAKETLKEMGRMSPTSLKLTLAQLRRGREIDDFGDIMTMEYRLSQACMAGHEFYEGARAALIDKDRTPKWEPASVEEVSDEVIKGYFNSLGDNDLLF